MFLFIFSSTGGYHKHNPCFHVNDNNKEINGQAYVMYSLRDSSYTLLTLMHFFIRGKNIRFISVKRQNLHHICVHTHI